jgi:hypothetical protein
VTTHEGIIEVPRHSAVGGVDSFVTEYLGRPNVTYQSATREQQEQMRILNNTRSYLDDIDSRSMNDMLARHQAQAEGLDEVTDDVASHWVRAETEEFLESTSTQDTGKIVMHVRTLMLGYLSILSSMMHHCRVYLVDSR